MEDMTVPLPDVASDTLPAPPLPDVIETVPPQQPMQAIASVAPWRGILRRPLDGLLTRQITRPMTNVQQNNLRTFWHDGMWASTSEAFTVSYIPLFALAYGASAGQIGLLTAIASLFGAIALFPGARLLERVGKRLPIVLWSVGTMYRGTLLLLALLPFVVHSRAVAIPLIISVGALRAFGLNLADPSMTSLAADLVPPYMRGRYFSLRNFLMGAATLVITPLAGVLISRTAAVTGAPLVGFQIAYLLAFATGMMATLAYSRIEEPLFRQPSDVAPAAPQSVKEILRGSRALRAFVICAFVWNMSVQIAAPYFNVYLVTELGGSAASVGLVGAASALAALFGQIFFGRLTDRKGSVWIFLATGFSITVLPMAWTFYTTVWQVGINNLFGGFLWAGYTLATFNLLLMLTPDAQRPRAAALYQTAVFTSAVIGPLIGGYLADNVSFPLIFMVSGLGRLVAMGLFVALGARVAFAHERSAYGN